MTRQTPSQSGCCGGHADPGDHACCHEHAVAAQEGCACGHPHGQDERPATGGPASLLATGSAGRMMIAGVAITGLWALTFWAMRG